MKENKGKAAVGFYLAIAAAVLAAAGILCYRGVMNKTGVVYVFQAVFLVLTVGSVLASIKNSGLPVGNLFLIVNAVLAAVTLTLGTGPMIREIAYVYAGLNPFSNIRMYVFFAAAMAAAWILSVAAAFFGMVKSE